MDYQRNGWFRPTGGYNRQSPVSPAANRTQTPNTAPARETACRIPTLEDAPSLAMVYSPYQKWRKIYDPVKALSRGTQFAELDKPFAGGRC